MDTHSIETIHSLECTKCYAHSNQWHIFYRDPCYKRFLNKNYTCVVGIPPSQGYIYCKDPKFTGIQLLQEPIFMLIQVLEGHISQRLVQGQMLQEYSFCMYLLIIGINMYQKYISQWSLYYWDTCHRDEFVIKRYSK